MAVLAKAALAVDLIARAHGPVRLSDAADALAMPKSSTHRLLNELVEHDILRRDDSGRFVLGVRLLSWGLAAEASYDLRAIAEPHMRRLSEISGESVNLHVVQNEHRVCIAAFRGAENLFPVVSIGQSLPLGIGATGKVLLAFSPDPLRDRVLTALAEQGRTVPTPAQLNTIRAGRWATSRNEQEIGLAAAATVISGIGGQVVAALAVGGQTERLSPARLEELRPELINASRMIGDQVTRRQT